MAFKLNELPGQKIRPSDINRYDIIYYNAQQFRTHPKPRPFLVLDAHSSNITLVPITHTGPDPNSIFKRFNLTANGETKSYLDDITNEKNEKNPKDSNFAVGNMVKLPTRLFYKAHQFPHRLGNLKDNISPKAFMQTIQEITKKEKLIGKEYQNGLKLRKEHTEAEIKQDPKLNQYKQEHTISKHQLRMISAASFNGLTPLFKGNDYAPAIDQQRYEKMKRQRNKKRYHRHFKTNKKKESQLDGY